MQILKDEVRHSILTAALAEFKSHDYSDASMRRISASAGMTTGNIYRYFKNKEELFEALVGPVYEKSIACIMEIKQEVDRSFVNQFQPADCFQMVENTIVGLFEESSAEMTILLNRSSGSKYADVKSSIRTLVTSILESVFMFGKEGPEKLSLEESQTAHMLGGTIVEGVCLILREHEDGDTVKRLVNQFILLFDLGVDHWQKN